MICSNLSGAITAEDVDCFAVNCNQHLAILHRQGLPCLPVLQPSGYHFYHTLRDYRHIQVQMDWIRHPGVAIVDDHKGNIIRGDAQERIDKVVRPQCYSRPVFESFIPLAQTYKIPGPLVDLAFLVELRSRVIITADHMPWEIAAKVAVIACLPSLEPDLGAVVDLRDSAHGEKSTQAELRNPDCPIKPGAFAGVFCSGMTHDAPF